MRSILRARCMTPLVVVAVLVLCGSALAAFVSLPAGGGQVNNDPPTIDPGQSAGLTDLAAGSLVAGNALVPWATFSQAKSDGSQQIVVRAFKNGAWQTEGFPASLNEDATKVAQAPSIDFTGASRTVPWVTWAEPSTSLGNVNQIFASRFLTQPPPAQNGGQWVHEGQGTVAAPSLNINTSRAAADPALAGGTTTAGANPAPWVTWQEFDGQQGACTTTLCAPQIFVSHAVPATGGTCPAGIKPSRGGSVGNFCFQQVGIDRLQGPSAGQLDPSLNIDPTRSGIEADIAFTGPNDTVPWVVWYENSDSNGGHPSGLGLFNADMAFAARGVADSNGDGGFHWQTVGLGTAGKTATDNVLDNGQSGHGSQGECAQTTANEQACSLDAFPATGLTQGNGAENPSVAAGTLVAGNATTPWIAWDESSTNGGPHSVFVARLVGGDHFALLNNGQPISHSGLDSTRADIVFAGNTPYVSWHESTGGTTTTFVGHFEGSAANPVFHIDTPALPTTPPAASDDDLTDVRSPVASTCPANPLTADGSACPGGAVGTPFYAFTNTAGGPRALFAQGYVPGPVRTGGASAITQSSATVAGTVNTDGAATLVHFEYGTSTLYGTSTAPQLLAPASGGATAVSAAVGSLPPGAVIHYRVVAQTDLGPVAGADATFTTASQPVTLLASHQAVVKGRVAAVKLACHATSGQRCTGQLTLTIRVKVRTGHGRHRRTKTKTVTLGHASFGLSTGRTGTISVTLSRTALSLLNAHHGRLAVNARIAEAGARSTNSPLTLKLAKKKHRR